MNISNITFNNPYLNTTRSNSSRFSSSQTSSSITASTTTTFSAQLTTAIQEQQPQKIQAPNNSKGSNSDIKEDYPLEYYSVPKWQCELFPLYLNAKIGATGGPYMREDMNRLMKNDALKPYAERYGDVLESHTNKIFDEEGIVTTVDHYQKLIVDKENSERIHQRVVQSLLSDSEAVFLSEKLNLPIK